MSKNKYPLEPAGTVAADTIKIVTTDGQNLFQSSKKPSDIGGGGGGPVEGSDVLSTGEVGGTKYLREDGDGTSSWQSVAGGGDLVSTNNLNDVASAATSRTNLDVDQAGTDNSTDVTKAGTGTYISLAGQVLTVDPITESDISDLQSYLTSETSHADVLVDGDIGVNVQAYSAILDATTASFLTTDETKLDGIEALADVTDAANVASAGAAMSGGAHHDGFSDYDANEHADITGTVTVTGNWTFNDVGDGGITSYDIEIGDTDGSPTYGIARFGNSIMGRTSYNAGNLDIDGSMVFRNVGAPATSNIETLWVDGSNSIRFALAVSGTGNATYNPRSMLIAGPSVLDDTVVTVGYWQSQGIFDNLVCNTSGDGADLGVQNDLEVEGDIFVDSILESTTAAGVTVENVLIKDGTVTAEGAKIKATATKTFFDIDGDGAFDTELRFMDGGTRHARLRYDESQGDLAIQLWDAAGTSVVNTINMRRAGTIDFDDTIDITGDITVTGTVDGIDIATDVAANTAKVTNATHTGDVTGSTALTIAPSAVDIAMMSASGTPSASTYLRGDNTWASIAGGGDLVSTNNLSDVASAATARTNLDVDQAGTDNSTDITLAGAGTYLSLAGQQITQNPITESDISDLGSYLPLAGGTLTGELLISSSIPQETFIETGATADEGRWDSLATGSQLRYRAVNDADSASTDWLLVDRTGITVDSVSIQAAIFGVTGNISVTGTVDGIDIATDVAANTAASHAESHSVASHSDTTATGAELNELTDGSVTTLHSHAGGGSFNVNPASFSVSGVHNITTTESTVVFDTEDFDPDTNYSNSSGEITVTDAGYYTVAVNVPINDDGTAGTTRGRVFGFLQRDQTTSTWLTVNNIRGQVYEREASGGTGFHAGGIVVLAAGELIRFRITVSSTVDVSTESGECCLNIHKIRDI